MVKHLVLLPALLSIASFAAAAPEGDIRRVLDEQVAAWNRGDVREFMRGYNDSAATTFVGAKVTKGHAQVLADYLKRYPSKERMGKLEFSGLEITPLCPDYASVIGHWHLTRPQDAGGDTGGIFTLLFRRTPDGWKIVLDHTS